ncbi:hypothetical protein T4B_13540 [Trichinella pseudospiralis]|uniref:Uncharacterized protein n=1 Tax=Trichinella pseudospiralis TaxID=6337 RepID=A0A0V1GQG8_TRIPS|nr:hypothetical protein T4B_13540 [Trichinella pseudospiralis]
MLIHCKVVSYLKISRDVFNQGGREYAHCTWQIVPNRLIPIMSTLVVSYLKISRDVFNQGGREYAHCTWQIVPNRLIPIMSTLVKITFSRKFRIFLRLARFAKNGEKLVFKF